MSGPNVNRHVTNAVFDAMGKHELVQNVMVDLGNLAPIYEEDQKALGLLNLPPRAEFVVQTEMRSGTVYSTLFQVALSNNHAVTPDMELVKNIIGATRPNEAYRAFPCALCGDVLLQPAKHLVFNIKPSHGSGTPNTELFPDRKPYDFMKLGSQSNNMNVAIDKP